LTSYGLTSTWASSSLSVISHATIVTHITNPKRDICSTDLFTFQRSRHPRAETKPNGSQGKKGSQKGEAPLASRGKGEDIDRQDEEKKKEMKSGIKYGKENQINR
jgi:hypothetical protein